MGQIRPDGGESEKGSTDIFVWFGAEKGSTEFWYGPQRWVSESVSSETRWCMVQEGGGLSLLKSMPNRKVARFARRRWMGAVGDGWSKGRGN